MQIQYRWITLQQTCLLVIMSTRTAFLGSFTLVYVYMTWLGSYFSVRSCYLCIHVVYSLLLALLRPINSQNYAIPHFYLLKSTNV